MGISPKTRRELGTGVAGVYGMEQRSAARRGVEWSGVECRFCASVKFGLVSQAGRQAGRQAGKAQVESNRIEVNFLSSLFPSGLPPPSLDSFGAWCREMKGVERWELKG